MCPQRLIASLLEATGNSVSLPRLTAGSPVSLPGLTAGSRISLRARTAAGTVSPLRRPAVMVRSRVSRPLMLTGRWAALTAAGRLSGRGRQNPSRSGGPARPEPVDEQ